MSFWLTNWRLDPWRWSPERLVARPDFESGLDEGHEGLVLAEGEDGLQEEDLRVAKLGVNLCFGPEKWPVLLLRRQKVLSIERSAVVGCYQKTVPNTLF